MPLLGKEPFVRHELPEDISPEEQIFVCKATNEAFLTYDQFFERQILCSSMVWTCSVTNRTGLTYEEALQSERNATQVLNSFPNGLQIPILYLMNYINESKIGSIVDMIYGFVNNRYFIAEEIEFYINTKRKSNAKVFRVIPPSDVDKRKEKTSSNIDPKLFDYELIDDNKDRHIVNCDRITRTKGVLTKDKIRLFLKQHLTSDKRFQPMTVKESSRHKFLNNICWDQMFSGPQPYFECQTPVPIKVNTSVSTKKSVSENNKNNSSEKNKSKNNKTEDKEKTKEDEKLEKEREREQKREWSLKRDDLACDDLKPLPEPVPLISKIPIELFSDTVFVMEFVHNFKDLIDINAIFPSGITYELMEQILFDFDIDGPFVDLIKVFLTTNFTLFEDQNNSTEKDESSDDEERHNRGEERIDRSIDCLEEKNPIFYNHWIQNHLGFKLSEINLDAYTITEVLRLYLLSSGGGSEDKSKYRGLYNSREDPAIEFVKQNEDILSKLKSDSVFDLKPEERLRIFQILIHQLLTYFEFREKIDDSFEEMTRLRKKIRDIQMEFNKWTKDNKPINKNLQNESQKSNSSNVTTASITEEINEFNREKSVKEEEKLQNIEEIRSEILKLQSCYGLKPIGSDRALRKYWIFQSLPGLFVQHIKPDTKQTNMPFGPCLPEPTPISSFESDFADIYSKSDSQRDDSSTTSDKENESNALSTNEDNGLDIKKSYRTNQLSCFDRCSANINSCAVHGLTGAERRLEWSFYYTCDHLNCLIESLNNRGFRESQLKFNLIRDKTLFLDYMNRCNPYKLNAQIPAPESRRSQRLQEVLHSRKRKQSTSRQSFGEAFETTLKEDLINLEEKLFAASLAVVTDLSRNEWRNSLQMNSNDKQILIESLSKAIISLKQSIRSMCLSVPLSDETSSQNWSISLCESSSLSQLFVHLSVLDNSIKWSKSAREAYCKICRRKCDAQNMLLCDQCNRGHHTYCLQPSLEAIPHGEWFCPDCCPKFKPQTPKKDKKYSKRDYESEYDTSDDQHIDETESESEQMESSQTISKSRSTTPQESDFCAHCRRTDPEVQLSCAECHQLYHLECVNVKRITRSDWFCHKCFPKKSDQKKRKESIDFSDDSTDESIDSHKPSKRCRYSRDSDYIHRKRVEEEEEKMTVRTTTRRRFHRNNGNLRKSLPLDFGLCEEILKKLQKHSDGWLFMSRPNHAPNYNQIIKQYVDFGQLVSNLNLGKYNSNLHFFRDVLLMLSNASFYNPIGSQEYKSCQSLAQYFQTLLKENGVEINN